MVILCCSDDGPGGGSINSASSLWPSVHVDSTVGFIFNVCERINIDKSYCCFIIILIVRGMCKLSRKFKGICRF